MSKMKLEDFKKQLQSTLGDKYIDGSKTINKCEWCDKEMTEEDHNFCDICDECREENEDE